MGYPKRVGLFHGKSYLGMEDWGYSSILGNPYMDLSQNASVRWFSVTTNNHYNRGFINMYKPSILGVAIFRGLAEYPYIYVAVAPRFMTLFIEKIRGQS